MLRVSSPFPPPLLSPPLNPPPLLRLFPILKTALSCETVLVVQVRARRGCCSSHHHVPVRALAPALQPLMYNPLFVLNFSSQVSHVQQSRRSQVLPAVYCPPPPCESKLLSPKQKKKTLHRFTVLQAATRFLCSKRWRPTCRPRRPLSTSQSAARASCSSSLTGERRPCIQLCCASFT